MGKAVGIGPKRQAQRCKCSHRRRHRFGNRAVGQHRRDRAVLQNFTQIGDRFTRPQARSVVIIYRNGKPNRTLCRRSPKNRALAHHNRRHGFAQDQVDVRPQNGSNFGVKRGGLIYRQRHLGPIRGNQRPHGSGDPTAAVGCFGVMRFRQCAQMQGVKHRIQSKPRQPIMVNGIGVGRGNGRAGGKIGRMNVAHQTGMIQHHPGCPQRRRLIPRAGQKFLSHAAIKKG